MSQPLISIVIPTYNHAHFLKRALDSVRLQTYPHWQLIVVNNYSEDDTIQVIEVMADSRIQLINFRNHGVIAASRNEGIRHASGQYVAFLDSDDQWYPTKLAACVAVLESGVDVVCHSEHWVYEDGLKKRVNYGPERQAQYERLLYRGNCLSTSATMVRKTLLDKLGGFCIDAQFVTAEDYELWLRLAKNGARFQFIEDVLGEYTIYHASASGNVLKHSSAVLAVIARHHHENQKQLSHWSGLQQQITVANPLILPEGTFSPCPGRRKKGWEVIWKANLLTLFKYRQARARVMGSGALTLFRQGYILKAWHQLIRALSQWPFASRSYVILLWMLFFSFFQRGRTRS